MAAKVQHPDPKPGQWQYELFEDLTGNTWHAFDGLEVDTEEKPTPNDYKRFFPEGYLDHVDQESDEFKMAIKKASLLGKTQYEAHEKAKEQFRMLMPVLAHLTSEEGRALLHLVGNNKKLDRVSSLDGVLEKELAQKLEEEKFDTKNYQRLKHIKLEYADKKRFGLDPEKLRTMFKHHDQFRKKFRDEIGTYEDRQEYTEFENKVLGIWHEHAFNSWKTLRDEIGLKERHKTLPFMKLADVNRIRDTHYNIADNDATVMNLMTSFFTSIDQTEYEDMFVGPGQTARFKGSAEHALISSFGTNREMFETHYHETKIAEAPEPKWGVSNRKQETKD